MGNVHNMALFLDLSHACWFFEAVLKNMFPGPC